MKKKLKKKKKRKKMLEPNVFKCPKCNKKYTQWISLQKHRETEHPEPPVYSYHWKIESSFLTFFWHHTSFNNIKNIIEKLLEIIGEPQFEGTITIRRVKEELRK